MIFSDHFETTPLFFYFISYIHAVPERKSGAEAAGYRIRKRICSSARSWYSSHARTLASLRVITS